MAIIYFPNLLSCYLKDFCLRKKKNKGRGEEKKEEKDPSTPLLTRKMVVASEPTFIATAAKRNIL